MKFCVGSDTHLEFGRGELEVPECDVLLLAGDIFVPHLDSQKENSKLKLKKRYKAFFKEVSEKCAQTFMVMGNHEHYGGFFGETKAKINHYLEPFDNITLLDNEEVMLSENIALFGATMWTDYNKEDPQVLHLANSRMSDHNEILLHRGSGPYDVTTRFRSRDAAKENTYTREKIISFLGRHAQERMTIVMTHHAPTWACVKRDFSSDLLSYAYANTGLDDLFLDDLGPDIWVHGHMHKRERFAHGKTEIICNARGYFGYQNTKDFSWLTVDLDIQDI